MNSATQSYELSQRAGAQGGRLLDVECGKGLAIVLVVIGHIAARDKPDGNDWYVLLQFLINSFHMAFFMYLAGYVFFYSGNANHPRPTYFGYLLRRAERLLVPFFALGILIVTGKLLASSALHVDNAPSSIWPAFRALIWDTGNSPAEAIWFVFVLFVYCAFVPMALRLTGNRLKLLIVGGAIAYYLAAWRLAIPSYVYVDRLATYLIFFLLGGLAQQHRSFLSLIDRGLPIFDAIFLLTLTCLAVRIFEDYAFVMCNFLGIPVMHGLARRASECRFLLWLGKYAFVIYLFNSIFIGLGKGIMLHLVSWHGAHFPWFALILGLFGLFGPVLAKQLLFRRVATISRLTD